jgi:hypothetical protein
MTEFRRLAEDVYAFLQPPLIWYMNGITPMPGEGHVTQTIANYKAIEALEADIYVAGRGPGTLADLRAQRVQLESRFQRARECFEQGMSYDAALQAFAECGIPLDFQRLVLLASYCEFTGKLPERPIPPARTI